MDMDAEMVQALRNENEALRAALRDLALSESDPEVARMVTEVGIMPAVLLSWA